MKKSFIVQLFIVLGSLAAILGSLTHLTHHYSQPDTGGIASSANMPPQSIETFNPVQVVPPFPAITNAPAIPADEATDEIVEPDELVLGVAIGNESRAYSINMLTNPTREIVNDRLGGTSIAATW